MPCQQVAAESNVQNGEHTYHPITFPSSEDDKELVLNRFSSSFPMPPPSTPPNSNSIIQAIDQKIPAASPSAELERPTRVAMAASDTSDKKVSQFSDEQLDYVRDFSWNLFQVLKSLSILSVACSKYTSLK